MGDTGKRKKVFESSRREEETGGGGRNPHLSTAPLFPDEKNKKEKFWAIFGTGERKERYRSSVRKNLDCSNGGSPLYLQGYYWPSFLPSLLPQYTHIFLLSLRGRFPFVCRSALHLFSSPSAKPRKRRESYRGKKRREKSAGKVRIMHAHTYLHSFAVTRRGGRGGECCIGGGLMQCFLFFLPPLLRLYTTIRGRKEEATVCSESPTALLMLHLKRHG